MNENKKWKIPRSFVITVLSFVLAFLIGGVVLALAGYDPIVSYRDMFVGIFSKPKYLTWVVIKSTPIFLTGLAVAFGLKSGLFNIGAEGQYIVGTMVAAILGSALMLPKGIHPLVCIIVAMIAAGLWGAFSGLLKAKFGINEVITCIMMNWIAFYLHNELVIAPWHNDVPNKGKLIQSTASTKILLDWKTSEAGRAFLKENPVIRSVMSLDVNWGFAIGILLMIAIWFILYKTKLGYELRAVGAGKDAAEHSGIPIFKRTVQGMFISGALAGAGGALQVLGVAERVSTLTFTEGNGFDGIAVALMGHNSPIACMFSSLFYGGLKYGGTKIDAPPEVVNILVGVVMLCIAAPAFIDLLLRLKDRRKRG